MRIKYNHPRLVPVGFQPALVEHLSREFSLRVLDLNPANIGREKLGLLIEDGKKDYAAVTDWAEVILCT